MARGNPDFFGQSMYKKYGGAQETGAPVNVGAGLTVDLINITFKGIIYNCECLTVALTDHSLDQVRMYVDGVLIAGSIYYNHLLYGFRTPIIGEPYLRLYDQERFNYAVEMNGEITVDLSFVMTYTNNEVDATDVHAYVTYAVVG